VRLHSLAHDATGVDTGAVPVLLTIGAVGVIAILMLIGFRQRWDPSPGPLPPSSMSVPAPAPAVLPRWFWVLFVAGPVATIVLVVISAATERRWIAVAGYVVLGLSWVVRQTVAHWISSGTTARRIFAVLRPASFILGFVVAAATDSAWWVLVGLILYLTILPLVDAIDWWRGRRSASRGQTTALPGTGDTRR
jgi:hypothetical protein